MNVVYGPSFVFLPQALQISGMGLAESGCSWKGYKTEFGLVLGRKWLEVPKDDLPVPREGQN